MKKRTCRQKAAQIVSAVVAFSLCLFSAGCSRQSETKQKNKSDNTESNGTIAVICKAQGVQFWDDVKTGADDAGSELNYIIDYQATANDTMLKEQIQLVEKAVENEVRAIVIAPNDMDGLNVVLDKAAAKNIPVIAINSDISHKKKVAYIGSDNISAGAVAAREVRDILPDGGKIAIIGHVESSQTAMERISGFKDELANDVIQMEIPVDDGEDGQTMTQISEPKYPIASVLYCDNNLETAQSQAAALLKENPDIKLIYGTNENSTTGICNAVFEAGKSGQVKVVGFNASDKEVSYIEDGTLSGTIVQNAYNMGYLGVKYADSAIKGNFSSILPEMITSVTLVTKKNLNNDDVRFLINPAENE